MGDMVTNAQTLGLLDTPSSPGQKPTGAELVLHSPKPWRCDMLSNRSARTPRTSQPKVADSSKTPRTQKVSSLICAMTGLSGLTQESERLPIHADNQDLETRSNCSNGSNMSTL